MLPTTRLRFGDFDFGKIKNTAKFLYSNGRFGRIFGLLVGVEY